jgi:hypothetical protein
MNDKLFVRISIIITLIGIFILFLLSQSIKINETTIEKINNEEISSNTKIKGHIKSIKNTDKYTMLTVTKQEDINLITYDNVLLNESDYVEIDARINDDGFIVVEKIVG